MTIKSTTEYDQHAHDQPTQATAWASEYGGDTRRTERSLRGIFGDSTYDAVTSAPATTQWEAVSRVWGAPMRGGRGPGSDTTIDRRQPGPSHVGASATSTKFRDFRNNGGGGIVERTPERDAQIHRDNPGLMDRWLQRGSRSDGGNG